MKVIILFVLIVPFSLNYKCGHDKIRNKINLTTIGNETKDSYKLKNRTLSSSSYHNIKIEVDYSSLFNEIKVEGSYRSNIEKAMDKTISMLQNLLQVEDHGKYKINSTECDKLLTKYYEVTEADLIIFPIVKSKNFLGENTIAAASACIIDVKNKRPILGLLYLGQNYNFSKTNADQYLKMLLLHELTHVLVFSQGLFRNFKGIKDPIGTTIVNGMERKILKTPKVVETARKYFNCNTLEGVEIEDQGGEGSAGSHWESRIMLGDYMISTNYDEQVISDITLALFEDSGWYKVNYYSGGLFRFGKGQGCEFLNKKCVEKGITKFDEEFCLVQNEEICFASLSTKGICYINKYDSEIPKEYRYFSSPNFGGFKPTDYCPVANNYYYNSTFLRQNCKFGVKEEYANLGEVIGGDSICINAAYDDVQIAICYPVLCNSKDETLSILVKNQLVKCDHYGQRKTVDGIKIICPKYSKVCAGSIWCNEPEECIKMKSVSLDIKDENFYIFSSFFIIIAYLLLIL